MSKLKFKALTFMSLLCISTTSAANVICVDKSTVIDNLDLHIKVAKTDRIQTFLSTARDSDKANLWMSLSSSEVQDATLVANADPLESVTVAAQCSFSMSEKNQIK